MRLIDADALIAKMATVMDMQDTYLPIHFKEWLIDTAPSIDIVRCKECKYWQTEWTSEEGVDDCHYCSMVDRSTFADWYCADGEREGE